MSVLLGACSSSGVWERKTEQNLAPTLHGRRPIVVAHRGASGYLPEHTLEAYTRAIEMGADFIEPDLVSTKDGVLIARHENEISGTTDVAEKFPALKRKKIIDGQSIEGWFTEDLTLAQIRTLRAKERLASRDHSSDGKFLVPTFEEVVQLALRKGAERARPVGLYPETKHPTYFRSVNLPLEDRLLVILRKYGLDSREAPVFVQSFEVGNLQELRRKSKVKLVQLLDEGPDAPYDLKVANDPRLYSDLAKPAGLREIARYADGVGPYKRHILPEDSTTQKLGPATSFVRDAHAEGLEVHPWTFRSDAPFLHGSYNGDSALEYAEFLRLGVDGLFSDFTDHAVRAREAIYQP